MNLSILETVFVTSWFWLFICAIVSLFSYVNGLDHTDDHFNWSTGFSDGWESGAESALELAEKYGLDFVRKARDGLQAQQENPPE